MRRERPSLVIFDCDGVLIDSEGPASRVFAEALSEIGLATGAAECRARYTGLSFRDCLADIESRLAKPLPEGWLADLRVRTRRCLDEETKPIPHALDVAKQVQSAGIAICVASSSEKEYLERYLGKTGFTGLFAGKLFSSRMVQRGKPAPDLFLHAAAAMNVRAEHAAVVEDSLPGVRGAIAAGMRVIGYAGDPLSDEGVLSNAGAEIIRDMRELPRLLAID